MTDRPPSRRPPPLPPYRKPAAPEQRVPALGDVRPRLDEARPSKRAAVEPSFEPNPRRAAVAVGLAPPATDSRSRARSREDAGVEARGGSRLLRALLWIGGSAVVLVAAAMVALTLWSPVGLVRDQLVTRVKAKTGRDLVIAGPTSLSFLSGVSISMADVTLSAPPAMGGEPTLRMARLEASLPLLSLLQRRVEVERLTLHTPVIDLHIDNRGRRSWDFAQSPAPLRYAQAGTQRGGQLPRELQDFVRSANPDSREAHNSRGPLAALEALSLKDVRIVGGVVRFADDRTGFATEVQAIDARLAMDNVSSPVEAKGSLTWRNEPVGFDVRLASPRQLAEERPARLVLKVSGRPLELDYDGTVSAGRSLEAEGALSIKSPSLPALLTMIGIRPAGAAKLNAASVAGRISASETAVTIADGKLALDDFEAQGTLTLEPRAGNRPLLRGNLQIASLDLNRLGSPTSAAGEPAVRPAGATTAPVPGRQPAAPSAPAPSGQPKSIEDLLRGSEPAAGTRVQGYVRRNGWSDEVIDLGALGLADADLKISLGRLVYRDIKTGQTSVRLALKDRALTATFDEISLYEGRGRGLLTVDGSHGAPRVGANFSLDGTAALAFLKDAADFDWIAGKARVNLALGASGATERQMIATLTGKAELAVKDGAVIGYNLQQALNGVAQGKFSGLERSANARTDFSELAGAATIQNGQAVLKDIRLTSQQLRMSGAGTADMPARTMDVLLKPKLVVAAGESAGLEVPVKLAGSWDKPTVAADLDALLKNPDQAVATAKQLGEQFKKANPEAVNKAKDLLNRFLRQ